MAGPTRRARGLEVAVVALVSVAACVGASPLVHAPVEVHVAPVDGGLVVMDEPASGRCMLRLVAGGMSKSSPSCYLDEQISENPGHLSYPCKGDGPAEANFGEHRYTGQVKGGELEIGIETELDWDDGCHWGTRAVIAGTLVSNGEPTSRKLTWQYNDRVMAGSHCSSVCSAKAILDVSTMSETTAPED